VPGLRHAVQGHGIQLLADTLGQRDRDMAVALAVPHRDRCADLGQIEAPILG
jgi:hypothetical protein